MQVVGVANPLTRNSQQIDYQYKKQDQSDFLIFIMKIRDDSCFNSY